MSRDRVAPPRSSSSSPSRSRCLAVWLVATAAAATVLAWLLPAGASSPPPWSTATSGGASFAPLLVAGCELAAAAAVSWLWLLVSLVVLEALDRPAPTGSVPVALRRLVLASCGLSLVGGLTVPAHAGAPGPGQGPGDDLVGLPVPDRTSAAAWQTAALRPPPAPARSTVVVAPGDSLWRLAARTLPTGVDPRAVDRRWRAIYRANHQLVGADPDLIHPGQRLLLPEHDGEE
ncbi:LysM peptidoglycan-binding domain-containing protein [Nocardioides coralli]|uniref:LysM peptidoglycan-binding domain-containing protein n=1 Tax=Nocardioides coralli TaxID=2872154 RepID=UPI001CA462D0|nr:LysM domain-containing protein [Nocardioides coralli]QZY30032.1 LysM peptidoglycan-binding domain-containing protein [Nocardioides coralli]